MKTYEQMIEYARRNREEQDAHIEAIFAEQDAKCEAIMQDVDEIAEDAINRLNAIARGHDAVDARSAYQDKDIERAMVPVRLYD